MLQGKKVIGHPVDVATGTVYSTHEDISIPGKVDLTWKRRYSTAIISNKPSPLGPGWTTRYFATLTRNENEYTFHTPEGEEEIFSDPEGKIEEVGVIRNFGTFQELCKKDFGYIITQWDIDTGEIERYVFKVGPVGWTSPLVSIEDITGRQALDLSYDEKGKLIDVRQRLEKRSLQLVYTKNNQVEKVIFYSADGGKKHVMARYEYDKHSRLISAYNALSYSDDYEYDKISRMTREIVKDGGVFYFKYDKEGRCVKTSGMDRYDEKAFRYMNHIGWTEVTNSLGHTTRYQYLPTGQVLSQIDSLGAIIKTEYDEYGRIISNTNPKGAITSYEYDEKGNRTKIISPSDRVREIVYNDHHQAVKMIDPAGNIWEREYDTYGRWIGYQDPLGNRWQFSYDSSGNIVEIIDPNGASEHLKYSRYGDLINGTDRLGNVTRYSIDRMGRLIKYTDCQGNHTDIEYDLMNNPLRITFPDNTAIDFSYDATGNITTITDPHKRTTRYIYGICERLLERIDPLGNSIIYTWGTEPGYLLCVENEKKEKHKFEYNAAGRIICETSFDNRKMEYEYDPAGNIIAKVNGCNERTTYVYDDAQQLTQKFFPDGSSVSFAYDAIGNIVTAKNISIAIKLERDPFGRVLKEIQGNNSIEHDYDAIGNVINTKTDLDHETAYQYNRNGYCISLQTNLNHRIDFEIDALGRETKRKIPGNIELDQKYDSIGQLLEQKLTKPKCFAPIPGRLTDNNTSVFPTSPSIIKRIYTYDGTGNLTKINDSTWGEIQYTYDRADHLIQAIKEKMFEKFTYDPCGNIKTINQLKNNITKSENLEYGIGNRLFRQGNTKFIYDENGRRTKKIELFDTDSPKEWIFEWDYDDQLISVIKPDGDIWNYEYDPFGRRISKKGIVHKGETGTNETDMEHFVWDGNVIIHHLNNENLTSTWIFEPYTFIPAAKISGNSFHSIIVDHIGTPRELIDANGKITWQARLISWGEIDSISINETDCPIRFQGQHFDQETGLHYNRFRYYDSENGHFLCADPIGLFGGLNEFSYAKNPIMWVDPFGLNDEPPPPPGASTVPKIDSIDETRRQALSAELGQEPEGRASVPGRPDTSDVDPRLKLLEIERAHKQSQEADWEADEPYRKDTRKKRNPHRPRPKKRGC